MADAYTRRGCRRWGKVVVGKEKSLRSLPNLLLLKRGHRCPFVTRERLSLLRRGHRRL